MDDINLLLEFSEYLKEKKQQEKKKVVAFIGHDSIPEELLDAAGIIPLKMMFAGNDDLMNISNDYLPSSTCSFAQTCVGLFSSKPSKYKFLNLVDYILVSNHCVSDMCITEIINKYFKIPRLNFYIPYTPGASSEKYFKLELLDLKKQLEDITGKEIKNEDIVQSLKKYSVFKKKLSEVNDLRIESSKKLEIFQKALLYGPSFLPELENLILKHGSIETQEFNNAKNIIFTGCSVFIGDYLIDLIEEGGGNIVFFDTWVGNDYYSQIFKDEDFNTITDPYDLLVLRFKENINADHLVAPYFLDRKMAQLKELIQEYNQKTGKPVGVINHIIKFCDHINIFQTFLKQELQKIDIRVLNLERDYSRANRGQISTRVEAFLEMM